MIESDEVTRMGLSRLKHNYCSWLAGSEPYMLVPYHELMHCLQGQKLRRLAQTAWRSSPSHGNICRLKMRRCKKRPNVHLQPSTAWFCTTLAGS